MNCPDDHIEGVWGHEFTPTTVTYEFRRDGEFVRYESINDLDFPGFLTAGTYRLGRRIINANGLEVCELQTLVGIGPPGCIEHVYIDEAKLYMSDCSLRLDFETPYHRIGDAAP